MKENKKKENKKKVIFVAVVLLITAMVLLGINYCAVKFCMGNLSLFTVMILVVPMVCIAITAFILGFFTKWNWKKEILIALLLTLISFGTGQITTVMAGDSLSEMNIGELQSEMVGNKTENTGKNMKASTEENTEENTEDEFMNELYDELDKQAYAYMLEQGLISEGDEIYAGEGNYGFGNSGAGSNGAENTGTGIMGETTEIASSEMYIGIQKSDSTTELIGNIVAFFIAFGACVVGSKRAELS